jgi:hypothetical protein
MSACQAQGIRLKADSKLYYMYRTLQCVIMWPGQDQHMERIAASSCVQS